MPVEVFVQGKRVVLSEATDFRGKGGEGSVYVKGGTAYKIHDQPAQMIPLGKLDELAALDRPNILRPLHPARDRQGTRVGYTMRYLEDAVVLCRVFPKPFRDRHGLTPERVLRLVRRLQEGIAYVHSRGVLIVDLNEMNFLLDRALGEVYFIDVNSYQTRGYPATALMESVRDPRCNGVFSELSDWFSFAVVSFAMFVGIHPYKGSHPRHGNANHWPEHMARGLSVLNPEVSVPSACLPFDAIPRAYRDWYQAVLEEGKRLPPPSDAQAVVVVAPRAAAPGAGSLFDIEEIAEFAGEILAHHDDLTLTTAGVYVGRRKVWVAPGDVKLGHTPRLRRPLAAWVEGGKLRAYDLDLGAPIPLDLDAEGVMVHEGRFIVKQGMALLQAEPVELAGRTLLGSAVVGNATAHSTALYDGVALQALLGSTHALLFPAAGGCVSTRLPELEGHALVEARALGGVLMVVAGQGGHYHRFVFRFGKDGRSYDCRVVSDVSYQGLNFAVLDTGVCLCLGENDDLEVFSTRVGAAGLKILRDSALGGDVRLFARGGQALFARGQKLYRFSMRGS